MSSEKSEVKGITFLPADPLIPLLELWCPDDSPEGKVYGKVKGMLWDYAEHLGITLGKLKIMDVYDGGGKLHPKILSYVAHLSPRNNQTRERLSKYRTEIRSRLRRLY